MISAYARYANGIMGSESFMPKDMQTALEINIPAEFVPMGTFSKACSTEVNDLLHPYLDRCSEVTLRQTRLAARQPPTPR